MRVLVCLLAGLLAVATLGCGYSGPNDPDNLEGKPCSPAGAEKYTGGGVHHFVCVNESHRLVWREQA